MVNLPFFLFHSLDSFIHRNRGQMPIHQGLIKILVSFSCSQSRVVEPLHHSLAYSPPPPPLHPTIVTYSMAYLSIIVFSILLMKSQPNLMIFSRVLLVSLMGIPIDRPLIVYFILCSFRCLSWRMHSSSYTFFITFQMAQDS